ncbi:stage III sporulation protein AH [Bacillus canaveralius]|uniref:Stage III sporulation protein AH n=1 Tax=Bacillus canaveralius TaxID=1403243 RepID=A0A2N5GRD7_9BACI|nr:SpoIIIAH-like family protein [Bacillus canaveralius]PLR85999.1 stage III sporulation protein AH [Bacillus canaveralius]PLS00118.1 stage III sporulation protein AH [Bacillus canaveralius]
MLLKKQTVWLLTMLSLVVVLSVYYITSPEQQSNDFAGVEEEKNPQEAENGAPDTPAAESKDESMVISGAASDDVFEELRLELNDKRSELKEQLTEMMASSELTTEEKSEAYDQMKELDAIAEKEEILETLIIAAGYDDALVRADGDKVLITIKAEENTPKAANEIIQMVKSEINEQDIAVRFHGSK